MKTDGHWCQLKPVEGNPNYNDPMDRPIVWRDSQWKKRNEPSDYWLLKPFPSQWITIPNWRRSQWADPVVTQRTVLIDPADHCSRHWHCQTGWLITLTDYWLWTVLVWWRKDQYYVCDYCITFEAIVIHSWPWLLTFPLMPVETLWPDPAGQVIDDNIINWWQLLADDGNPSC